MQTLDEKENIIVSNRPRNKIGRSPKKNCARIKCVNKTNAGRKCTVSRVWNAFNQWVSRVFFGFSIETGAKIPMDYCPFLCYETRVAKDSRAIEPRRKKTHQRRSQLKDSIRAPFNNRHFTLYESIMTWTSHVFKPPIYHCAHGTVYKIETPITLTIEPWIFKLIM